LVKAYEWTLAVDKVDKAGQSLKRKKEEIEGAKEDIARGGRECEGMENESKEIQKRREKVRSHFCPRVAHPL
jgi:structural maintenance of chromosome 2